MRLPVLECMPIALAAALGGALLILIFEGTGEIPERDSNEARAIVERAGGHYEGEGPAKNWLAHRYAVSYRQAPIFAAGAFPRPAKDLCDIPHGGVVGSIDRIPDRRSLGRRRRELGGQGDRFVRRENQIEAAQLSVVLRPGFAGFGAPAFE